jgi:hypothetical protein
MILHDETFEDLAKAPVKTTDVVFVRKITEDFVEDEEQEIIDDVTATWSSSDLLMEIKIDAVGEMLGSATKKAAVKMLGIVDGINVDELFQVRVGLLNSDPSVSGFNYISLGYFLVEEIDFNYEAGYTLVTLYDHMWKAGKTRYTEAVGLDFIEYPISVEDFATTIAAIIDVGLDPSFGDLPNADYVVQEDLYSTISTATLKNVIEDIAGATGTTARITDTTLVFSQYEVSDENLSSEELKKLKIGGTYGPITSVILGRVPQNDNIAISATAPAENEVTDVDTTADTLTIADHGMSDGTLVRLETSGTMPAPLMANTNYYVFTDGDLDIFSLAPTYEDAVSGTNLIDITTTGSGLLTIPTLATREIRINNNEILDDAREELLPPLYNTLAGIDWTDVKADTVGLAWHEVGDVIQFSQGDLTVKAFLVEIHITLDGSIKEQLVSTIPDVATINYAAAGGITKTIYNTEIKVDKQAQEITSVVSRQDTLEGVTNQNFSEIYQDVDDVLITIQRAGGGNILYNSVGFAKESFRDINDIAYDKLLYWTYPDPYDIDTNGRATSYSSSDSQAAGGISGQVIEMSGTDMSISQRVTVGAGVPLCFALRASNIIGTGSATVTLANDADSWEVEIDDAQTYEWAEFKLENFTTSQPWLNITIQVDNAQRLIFTDLRLMYGSTTQGWVQANGEILSANVQFTTEGVRVFDSVHDTETRMTFNEFSTRRKSDGAVLFEADDLGIITNNLSINGRTSYIRDDEVIVKQITVGSSNPKSGLAFIKVAE